MVRKKFNEPCRQHSIMVPNSLWAWVEERRHYNGTPTDIFVRAVKEMKARMEMVALDAALAADPRKSKQEQQAKEQGTT